MRLLASLILVVSLSSCARIVAWERAEVLETPANYHPLATTPREAAEYIRRNIPRKTLKKWDAHVSDDTLIIEVESTDGNAVKGSAR